MVSFSYIIPCCQSQGHNYAIYIHVYIIYFPGVTLYIFFLFLLIYGGLGFGFGFLGLGFSVDLVWGLWCGAFLAFCVSALYINIKE